ncbi:triose-phosphate isomerase [Segetibacter koreensis]|uniref:triose-phosphate isomerase n=1 Tax=Segetibacter koreensis TaxID=398037 RepID=UPI0003A43C62|nr:triose-phosphate isomerase [Segetibacter koreensis]
MRTQIAAANWKMNLTLQEAQTLLDNILKQTDNIGENRKVIFAVPACYLTVANEKIANTSNVFVAAQNVYSKKSGAFTGELSVTMLKSINVNYAVIGHSERREYFNESNQFLADKVKICLEENITPIFCCGEALPVREVNQQNDFVTRQLEESLFSLSAEEIQKVIIAYEPIWAIGTGKTASSDQAQEMHAHIRTQIGRKYGEAVADGISILYGGSVKASNAKDIFGKPDVDGGLVGGSSLIADEFVPIIKALK